MVSEYTRLVARLVDWDFDIEKLDERDAILAAVPHLRRYALALLRDVDAADDLVQDCIHRALSKFHLFQSGTNMRAWLFTILHNLRISGIRSQIQAREDIMTEQEIDNRFSTPPDQENGLMLRDFSRALDLLEDQHKEVLLLIGLEGLSYKQTSEVLDIPLGTVMSRLARGRDKLRLLLSERAAPTLRRVK